MIHPAAEIDSRARIGADTRIWHHAQVREDARIGHGCIIGKGVYVDVGVRIGSNCKIQNGVTISRGATLEDGVLIGPGACVLNDSHPRAITPGRRLQTDADWEVGPVLIRFGASLGGGAIILPNVTVGEFALVGAGAVVTRDVPDYALAVGNPARVVGYVCRWGRRLRQGLEQDPPCVWSCAADGSRYRLTDGGLAPARPDRDPAR